MLKEKNYLKLFCAGIICRFADSLDVLVYSWMTYIVTGSATCSALVYGANQLPTVLIQPIAGALVENINKKSVYIITNIIRGIVVALIMTLYIGGKLSFFHLFTSTFLISTVEAFNSPASTALVPLLLKRDMLSSAVTLSATLNPIAQLLGSVFGGVLIGLFGISVGLLIDMLLFLCSAIIVGLIHLEKADNLGKNSHGNVARSLIYELKYMNKNKEVFDFCIIAFLINFAIVPLNSLQSPLADMVYGSGSDLISIIGITIIIGNCTGPIIASLSIAKKCSLVYVASGISVGILMMAYALGGYISMSLLLSYIYCGTVSLLLGISVSIVSTRISIKLIETVRQDYLSRTSSIMNAIGCLANPLAAFSIGFLTNKLKVWEIFILWGIISILSFLTYYLCIKIRTKNCDGIEQNCL